jgi:hypothetical protein
MTCRAVESLASPQHAVKELAIPDWPLLGRSGSGRFRGNHPDWGQGREAAVLPLSLLLCQGGWWREGSCVGGGRLEQVPDAAADPDLVGSSRLSAASQDQRYERGTSGGPWAGALVSALTTETVAYPGISLPRAPPAWTPFPPSISRSGRSRCSGCPFSRQAVAHNLGQVGPPAVASLRGARKAATKGASPGATRRVHNCTRRRAQPKRGDLCTPGMRKSPRVAAQTEVCALSQPGAAPPTAATCALDPLRSRTQGAAFRFERPSPPLCARTAVH